ncbi:MAG: WYL domain-containing protein [Sciscionella sp.]|nr:WYL domain-containing protein [Sciscionella sp.]
MSTARAERLVNLVICLLSTRQYLTAEKIRGIVPGYADAASDEAFFRMFERDKAELRDLGIPLETGHTSAFDAIDGYRIARRDYELGEVELAPDEAAAVALAARLWDSPELTSAAHGALLKLRAAGVDVDDTATGAVEPVVRTTEPTFAPLLAAVRAGRVVRFDYRRPSAEVRTRTVQPWGVVSYRGRWYLVGHDHDRDAPRCFRLTRIVGDVTTTDQPTTVPPPEGANLLEYVLGSNDGPPPAPSIARLWVAVGRAQGLRRRAKVIDSLTVDGVTGDVLEIELRHLESAADWIAGHGPDVGVLAPETLAKGVRERLLAAVDANHGSRK